VLKECRTSVDAHIVQQGGRRFEYPELALLKMIGGESSGGAEYARFHEIALTSERDNVSKIRH